MHPILAYIHYMTNAFICQYVFKVVTERREIIENNLFELTHEKLCVGQEIKNYKELCKILGLPEKAGNSKVAQITTLNQFCRLEKNNHKFIVKEIYDCPLTREDKRHEGNRSLYVTLIESILLNYFLNNGKKEKVSYKLSKKELYKILGMINDNYSNGYSDKKKLLHTLQCDLKDDYHKLKPWYIDDFYSRSIKKLNEIIISALNNLSSRKLISYKVTSMAKITIDGKPKCFEVKYDWQLAKIMEIERMTIDKMIGPTKIITNKDGNKVKVPTTIKDILFNKDPKINYDKYWKRRNRLIKEALGFDYVYKVYSIICNKTYLERALEENVSLLKSELNSEIIDYLDNQAQKRKDNKGLRKYGSQYLEMQQYLSKILLDINKEQLVATKEQLEALLKNIALDAELNELFG